MDDVTRLPEEATSGTEVGATSVASERFEPGTIFAGRFRIVAPLGKGGMGEVYRADDLKLEQSLALKLLPEDLATFYTFLTRELFPLTIDFSRPYAGAILDAGNRDGG